MILASVLMIYFGSSSSQNSYIETLLILISALLLGLSMKLSKKASDK